ncbi:hypothetical protein Tco_0483987 [Tanacetum coccineum]
MSSTHLPTSVVEGGLGIRNWEKFNIALMTTHIWNIISRKESMWVRWIHLYKLKGRSFWGVPVLSNVPIPILTANKDDQVVWKDVEGRMHEFAVRNAWNSIRPLVLELSGLVWLFTKETRMEEQVCDTIIEIVRLKHVSLRFKRTPNVLRTLQAWKIPYEET